MPALYKLGSGKRFFDSVASHNFLECDSFLAAPARLSEQAVFLSGEYTVVHRWNQFSSAIAECN